MKTLTITMDEYCDVCDSYQGYCTTCGKFTREMTEPDACNYDCPICDENTVMGAEEAMIQGILTIK